MTDYTKAASVSSRCTELKDLWSRRNTKIADWYSILSLTDELRQENMESVVSNDPRTFYNNALHLLAPNIPHRIPTDGLDRESIAWSSSIERVVTNRWSKIDREYRRRGRKSWMEYITGLLLVTGWYSVLTMATEDKLLAEIWNPVEVFPDWSGSGLESVAHIFTITPQQAKNMARQQEWELPGSMTNKSLTLYDLWEVTDEGIVNATVVENILVKPGRVEPFEEIPILVGPAGGLPDDGPISSLTPSQSYGSGTTKWREEIGQSILATNEGVYKQQNRIMTFMQQILRDTAQPKYWEKSRGQSNILTEADLSKRGAIFRLAEGDDVGTIAMPGIPVELTSLIGSYEQMVQRGSLPHALSGQVQNIPLGLMSQVAAAAVQVLSLYHKAITGILTDIDNIWVDGIIGEVYTAETITIPKNVSPDVVRFNINYAINIPGDLIQRATVTRMISPSARMSAVTALDMFFPEIPDPLAEAAMARSEDAQQSPVFAMLSLISALREESRILRQGGNSEDADLLDQAQLMIMSQIQGQQEQQPPSDNGAGGVPANGVDPRTQQIMAEMGLATEGGPPNAPR